MAFKVGDLAVCVSSASDQPLKVGKTYTITGFRTYPCGCECVSVDNITNPDIITSLAVWCKCRCGQRFRRTDDDDIWWFFRYRFRPLEHHSCSGSRSIAKKFKEVIETSENPVRETKTEKV